MDRGRPFAGPPSTKRRQAAPWRVRQGSAHVLKLSILIAAGNEAALEATLISVLQNRPADCEIVVVHDDSYQDRYDLGSEVRFVLAPAAYGELERPEPRGGCLSRTVLHVLRCGAEAMDGWTNSVLAHFADPRVATVSPLVLNKLGDRVESAGLDYRPGGRRVPVAQGRATDSLQPDATRILGPTLDAAFYRTAAMRLIRGPFHPTLGSEYADVDVALRLQQAGYRAVCEPASRVAAPAARPRRNALASGWLAERLFWRHFRSFGNRSVVNHVGLIIAEAAGSVIRPLEAGRSIGRAAGWLEHLFFGSRTQLEAARPDTAKALQLPSGLRVDGPSGPGRSRSVRRQDAPKVA